MGGQWITVGRKDTLGVRPGQTLKMRGSLASPTGTTQLPFTVRVPAVPKGRYGVISLTGGSDFSPRGLNRAQTPQELIDVLAKAPRNDQAVGELDIFGRRTQVSSTTTDPFGTVVRGAKLVQVQVKY
jgi:hypothetical protein